MLALVSLLAAILIYNDLIRRRNNQNENESDTEIQQQKREHQLLLESVHHYPMPYAVYDENNKLIVWNNSYEKIYKRVFDKFSDNNEAKGMDYRDLLRGNIEDDKLDEAMEESIKQRAIEQQQSQHSDSKNFRTSMNDRHYPDLGWFRVSKYWTPSGGVAGFAIDISELKQREEELVKEVEHRKQLEVEIRKIANTDVLTNLSNRRHFMECAQAYYTNALDEGLATAVMMIDIDNFKIINDIHGHTAGDGVISTTAKILSTRVDSERGLTGRLGGEEFAILLRNSDAEEARPIAEEIRSSVELVSYVDGNTSFSVTVSIGVAASGNMNVTLSQLLKDADDALYVSKRTGRNLVTLAKASEEIRFKKTG